MTRCRWRCWIRELAASAESSTSKPDEDIEASLAPLSSQLRPKSKVLIPGRREESSARGR